MMQALQHLQANAERLGVDRSRIALAGDSAGAHIAAQLGALITTPGYAARVGIPPTTLPAHLRCLVLACGPYDLALARRASSPAGSRLVQTVLWAYRGNRRFFDDPAASDWSVTNNLSPRFPPTLITVGNADPLKAHSEHSELLADKLHREGVETETLFYPQDHKPPLGHEYQLELDTDAAQRFLEHVRKFLQRLTPA